MEILEDRGVLRENENAEEGEKEADGDQDEQWIGDGAPDDGSEALDEFEVAAEAEENAGKIAAFDTGLNEAAVEGREVAAEFVEGLIEGSAFFELGGEALKGGFKALAVKIGGDETKALFQGETGGGELGDLLVEGDKVVAAKGLRG